MRNVFFALFADPKEADAAVQELDAIKSLPKIPDPRERNPVHAENPHVEVHRGRLDNESLPVGETYARGRLIEGILLSSVGGALLGGFVLGPMGVVSDALVSPAVLCAGLGALFGGLGGLLTGIGAPDPRLERMSRALEHGGVIVSVEVAGDWETGEAEKIVRRHGAEVQYHATV
jgi:hypothetical protein